MQLFYTPDTISSEYTLSELESKHCIKVLRMKEGDQLFLTNGKGFLYRTVIDVANPKKCQLKVTEVVEKDKGRNYHLHIAIAPTKNIERFEWFLEKTTEIGVDEITPLIVENSERKVVKADRMERVVVAAMKQSLKFHKPLINPILSLKEFLNLNARADLDICMAHCYDSPKVQLADFGKHINKICVMIGPEGDFSNNEVALAKSQGIASISLGNSRLRTETAGVVACHTISLINSI